MVATASNSSMSSEVQVAIIGAVGAVVVAGISVLGVMIQRTHRLVNSRLAEMIALAEQVGIAKGKQQEIARRDAEDLIELRSKASGPGQTS